MPNNSELVEMLLPDEGSNDHHGRNEWLSKAYYSTDLERFITDAARHIDPRLVVCGFAESTEERRMMTPSLCQLIVRGAHINQPRNIERSRRKPCLEGSCR